MKRITLAAAALTALTALAPLPAPAAPADALSTLTVTGQASVDRLPDQSTASFTIVSNDADAARATSANNGIYNTLVAKLGGLGLAATAIRTTQYDVGFNQRPDRPNPQYAERYGYVVTRGVSVTIPNTTQVGAVIDAGVAAGVTNVGAVGFGIKDNRGAYRAALIAAVADADGQAHALADAAHVRVVRILSLNPANYFPIRAPNVIGRVMSAAAPVPTEVAPSNLSVSASVTITYVIAP